MFFTFVKLNGTLHLVLKEKAPAKADKDHGDVSDARRGVMPLAPSSTVHFYCNTREVNLGRTLRIPARQSTTPR